MFWAFLILLILVVGFGVLCWFIWQRVTTHMKNNPEAARLIAEHVIAPILMGGESKAEDKPDPKKIKGTLI